MAKDKSSGSPPESVISIVGPGMKVVGDLETDGTVRVEGVVEGTVRAGKAVVVGKEGTVEGEILTQDVVVSGTVRGRIVAESRLELQTTARIDGEVNARRMQLEEGAVLNATVEMGEVRMPGSGGREPKESAESAGGGGEPPSRPEPLEGGLSS